MIIHARHHPRRPPVRSRSPGQRGRPLRLRLERSVTAPDPALAPASPAPSGNELAAWQRRLLPLMAAVLTSVSAVFLVLSLLQTNHVRAQIENAPTLALPVEVRASCLDKTLTAGEKQACVRWKVLVQLEAYTVAHRYHQANSALIVRAWIKNLAIGGAVFILGKLSEAPSNLSAESSGWKVSIASASPGLILAVLGTALII